MPTPEAARPPSIDDVRGVLRHVGIADALSVLPPDRGGFERTHVWVLDEVVVKVDYDATRGGVRRECAALELLAGTDLPVPRLIGHGELADGRPWLVMTRLDGEAPPDAAGLIHQASERLAEQMGAIAAHLHAAVTPPGFGAWAREPSTLADADRGRCARLIEMAKRLGAVPDRELDHLVALLEVTRLALDGASPKPVLAHRDLQPRNVLVDSAGGITALIDFESAAGGDRLEDFRSLALDWASPTFAAACRGYRAAGGTLDADAPERLAHFVLGWSLAIFAYLAPLVPAYLPAARVAIDRVASGERPGL